MLFLPEFPWSDLHTLNLDWLLSVVASHERQLRDIEGSASPYDEAPLADGVAEPGTVNQFARGDHRHPTDTTRASVAALQAVQDTVPGPSNGNPRMDGTANPGTYTYYSRADHVHPSDTSKLDKTGGEVTGLLDILPRRCQAASLPSAGWYRAIAYNAGNYGNGEFAFIVTLKITRANAAGNEVHEIKFLASSNRLLFADEISCGNAASINKIRYTYNQTTGYAYIDIHTVGALNNAVTVDFDVATLLANRSKFNAAALQSVADSPSGESVLADYTFAANTEADGTIVGATGFTPEEIDVKRSGRVVYVHFYMQNLNIAANTETVIGSLSGVPAPKKNIRWLAGGGAHVYDAASPVYAYLGASGNFVVTSPTVINAVNMTISYIV